MSPRHVLCITAAVMFVHMFGCSAGTSSYGPNGSSDDASPDESATDGGLARDANDRDASTRRDGEASPPAAVANLTFSGDCRPDLSDLVVTTNVVAYDSLGVANAQSPLSGSFQLQLVSARRTLSLSSAARSVDRDVVNVIAGGTTYTNLCNSASSNGCMYDAATKTWRNDPIAGTVEVLAYEPRAGRLSVRLTGVTLQAVSGLALCRVSGTLETTRLGR